MQSLSGVWLGMSIGNCLSNLMLGFAFCRIDWDREAANAGERVKSQNGDEALGEALLSGEDKEGDLLGKKI